MVLIHGLWVNGMDMSLLRHRLSNRGFAPAQFSYHSIGDTPRANAVALNAFVAELGAPAVHFVAHSLGGLVLRHLFHEYPGQPPGRVVTLGTPHAISSAARSLSRWLPGRLMLGRSVDGGLLGGAPSWDGKRELGSLAGTIPIGLGMVLPGIPAPNDGTVAVEETRLRGMADHLVLPVSHFGMLFSRRVAYQVGYFLRQGRFDRNAGTKPPATSH